MISIFLTVAMLAWRSIICACSSHDYVHMAAALHQSVPWMEGNRRDYSREEYFTLIRPHMQCTHYTAVCFTSTTSMIYALQVTEHTTDHREEKNCLFDFFYDETCEPCQFIIQAFSCIALFICQMPRLQCQSLSWAWSASAQVQCHPLQKSLGAQFPWATAFGSDLFSQWRGLCAVLWRFASMLDIYHNTNSCTRFSYSDRYPICLDDRQCDRCAEVMRQSPDVSCAVITMSG